MVETSRESSEGRVGNVQISSKLRADLSNAALETLTAVERSSHKAHVRCLLTGAERLCDLLWSCRSHKDEDRVFGLRYTLIRRLVALEANKTVAAHCWALLKDLLHPRPLDQLSTLELSKICSRRRDENVFVTVLIGTFLILVSALSDESLESSDVYSDLLQLSSVTTPLLTLILNKKVESSSKKHVRSLISNSLRVLKRLHDVLPFSDMSVVRKTFLDVIVRCLEHSLFGDDYIFEVCAQLLHCTSVSESCEYLLPILRLQDFTNEEKLVPLCWHVAYRAIQLDAREGAIQLFCELHELASSWYAISLKVALRLTRLSDHMLVYQELSYANQSISQLLQGHIDESMINVLVRIYVALAREVRSIGQHSACNCSELSSQVMTCSLIGLQLLELTVQCDSATRKICSSLPELCVANILVALLLESSTRDITCFGEFHEWSIVRDSLEQLLTRDEVNTVSTRRVIHTVARKCQDVDWSEAAETLYALNVRCCERLDGAEARRAIDCGERDGRIRSFFSFLWLSNKRADAINVLIQHSKHYGTSKMPFELLLELYTDMTDTEKDSALPLVPRLLRCHGHCVQLLESVIEEYRFWTDSALPVDVKHRLQYELIDSVANALTENKATGDVDTAVCASIFSRLLRMALPRPPQDIEQCGNVKCVLCKYKDTLDFFRTTSRKYCTRTKEDNLVCTALSVEFSCHTALALVSMQDKDAYREAHKIVEQSFEHIERLHRSKSNIKFYVSNAVRNMLEALQEICEVFNVFGTTYLSSKFRQFICPDTTSHVASILLAPIPSPCLFISIPRYRQTFQRPTFHEGRSMLLLAGIAAERGKFSEAFACIEVSIASLRTCLHSRRHSHQSVHDREKIAVRSQPPFFCVLGTYVSTLCTKAAVCTELGMFSSSVSALEEAMSLSKIIRSYALQGAIHLRKAYMYRRFDHVDDCNAELEQYKNTVKLDISRTLCKSEYDLGTKQFASAFAFSIESMSCVDLTRRVEMHEAALKCAQEALTSPIKTTSRERSNENFEGCASWRSAFTSLYAKLLCHDAALQSVGGGKSLRLLRDVANKCRQYQPILAVLTLTSELIVDCSVDLHLGRSIPHASGLQQTQSQCTSLREKCQEKLFELMSRCRDTPVVLWELNAKMLFFVLSSDQGDVYEVVRVLHACFGAPMRSQNVALLKLNIIKQCTGDEDLMERVYKLRFGSFSNFPTVSSLSIALEHLEISQAEVARLKGIPQLAHCLHQNLLELPVVTLGLVHSAVKAANVQDELVISRVDGIDRRVVCVRVRHPALRDVFTKFADTLARQHDTPEESCSRESKLIWWETRILLDARLHESLDQMNANILGPWRVLLLGRASDQVRGLIEDTTRAVVVRLKAIALRDNLQLASSAYELTFLMLSGAHSLSDGELHTAFASLMILSLHPVHEMTTCLVVSSEQGAVRRSKLDLSEIVTYVRAQLSGELNNSSHMRVGGYGQKYSPVLLSLDETTKCFAWESLSVLGEQQVYRNPSIHVANAARVSTQNSLCKLNLGSAFYVLNPTGDLVKTQQYLTPLLAKAGWDGVIGTPPTVNEVRKAFQDVDFYFYFGHGGGQDIIKIKTILDSCIRSVMILMGCSSGAYEYFDNLSPTSISMLYLLCGAPTVLANLWDVTDVDIDRFSARLLQDWLSRTNSTDDMKTFYRFSTSLQDARNACRLKHLVGAAPVLYGVPAVLDD
ncbi:Peptidase C50, separase [Ostreococcus tauri]|uniref:separase n=2 Tax=Ostreococcus tauri TaxID=70448 RepID=A0A090MBI8_OSTTA|nr:Peptidase C50, separase [Ostreococcus tauri]CEG00949.1 Peptidase C50, separase [Ostreococcus tauri]|eukprot:XP_022840693.1 Peptidase C50, separase [Ostreococcus tauri]